MINVTNGGESRTIPLSDGVDLTELLVKFREILGRERGLAVKLLRFDERRWT